MGKSHQPNISPENSGDVTSDDGASKEHILHSGWLLQLESKEDVHV